MNKSLKDPLNRNPRPYAEVKADFDKLALDNTRAWARCTNKKLCMTDCEAFVPARINKVGPDEWALVGYYCDHRSLNKRG